MQKWIKLVPIDKIQDGVEYFLGIESNAGDVYGHHYVRFYGKDKRGKTVMTWKPGLAMRIVGGDKLRDIIRDNASHVCIEIPANAARRWTKR